jgi:hypothetical protein
VRAYQTAVLKLVADEGQWNRPERGRGRQLNIAGNGRRGVGLRRWCQRSYGKRTDPYRSDNGNDRRTDVRGTS